MFALEVVAKMRKDGRAGRHGVVERRAARDVVTMLRYRARDAARSAAAMRLMLSPCHLFSAAAMPPPRRRYAATAFMYFRFHDTSTDYCRYFAPCCLAMRHCRAAALRHCRYYAIITSCCRAMLSLRCAWRESALRVRAIRQHAQSAMPFGARVIAAAPLLRYAAFSCRLLLLRCCRRRHSYSYAATAAGPFSLLPCLLIFSFDILAYAAACFTDIAATPQNRIMSDHSMVFAATAAFQPPDDARLLTPSDH